MSSCASLHTCARALALAYRLSQPLCAKVVKVNISMLEHNNYRNSTALARETVRMRDDEGAQVTLMCYRRHSFNASKTPCRTVADVYDRWNFS